MRIIENKLQRPKELSIQPIAEPVPLVRSNRLLPEIWARKPGLLYVPRQPGRYRKKYEAGV